MRNARRTDLVPHVADVACRRQELPAVPPQLTSELLSDPWLLAKITINLDTASQWPSKREDFSVADEYVQCAGDPQPLCKLLKCRTPPVVLCLQCIDMEVNKVCLRFAHVKHQHDRLCHKCL